MKMEWIPRLCALAVILLSAVPAAVAAEVTFVDANLEAAVRDELGIPAPTPITEADMAGLRHLDASRLSLFSLDGLEAANNLRVLNLHECGLEDTVISTVGSLEQLEWLTLRGNALTTTNALSSLNRLTFLDIADNPLVDYSGLQPLTQLEGLHLDKGNLADVSILSNLKGVGDLILRDNSLSELGGISSLSDLWFLDAGQNEIAGMVDVSGWTGLRFLWLYDNAITSLIGLENLQSLEEIILPNNSVSDIQFLADLGATGIDHIDLRGNPLNQDAHDVHIPAIQQMNPNVHIEYDPIPEPSSLLLLVLMGTSLLHQAPESIDGRCHSDH